jgi:hypothetical protein
MSANMAFAKTVNMGTLSRETVSLECGRAGSAYYEMPPRGYGCYGHVANVFCTDDGGCAANMTDLIPVHGNGIAYILSLGRTPFHSAVRVGPIRPINNSVVPHAP